MKFLDESGLTKLRNWVLSLSSSKQDKLTEGNGISISANTVSANVDGDKVIIDSEGQIAVDFSHESFTFTLADGSTVTKELVLWN